MNLRKSLVTGESHEGVGLLKGHVEILRIKEDKLAAEDDCISNAPSSTESTVLSTVSSSMPSARKPRVPHPLSANWGMRPVEHLWARTTVSANVYVLTARE